MIRAGGDLGNRSSRRHGVAALLRFPVPEIDEEAADAADVDSDDWANSTDDDIAEPEPE